MLGKKISTSVFHTAEPEVVQVNESKLLPPMLIKVKTSAGYTPRF